MLSLAQSLDQQAPAAGHQVDENTDDRGQEQSPNEVRGLAEDGLQSGRNPNEVRWQIALQRYHTRPEPKNTQCQHGNVARAEPQCCQEQHQHAE
jgi:hypothetical protein